MPLPQKKHNRSFSLTLVLCDILHQLGFEHDVDDLHAIMGLSVLVCTPANKQNITPWSLLGRDILLIEAAHSIGLTIRELHPPEAACNLYQTEEFTQHFEASYLPLVERALENDQPVIAWQGWPKPSLGLWACVTGTTPKGIGLQGRVFPTPENNSSADQTNNLNIPLTKPPVQLYVVESARFTPLSNDTLFRTALEHARIAHSTERANRFNIVTGTAAYDNWVEALEDSGSQRLDSPWSNYAASIVAGHTAELRFLEKHENTTNPKLRKTVAELRNACAGVIKSLENLTPDSPLSLAIDQVRIAQQHAIAITNSISQTQ